MKTDQEVRKDVRRTMRDSFIGGVLGILLYTTAPLSNKTPFTGIPKDVNNDGIEDIVLYNSQGKQIYTLIGIQDSSKNITYGEAKAGMEYKKDMLQNQEFQLKQKYDSIKAQVYSGFKEKIYCIEARYDSTRNKFETQKLELKNSIKKYEKTGEYK